MVKTTAPKDAKGILHVQAAIAQNKKLKNAEAAKNNMDISNDTKQLGEKSMDFKASLNSSISSRTTSGYANSEASDDVQRSPLSSPRGKKTDEDRDDALPLATAAIGHRIYNSIQGTSHAPNKSTSKVEPVEEEPVSRTEVVPQSSPAPVNGEHSEESTGMVKYDENENVSPKEEIYSKVLPKVERVSQNFEPKAEKKPDISQTTDPAETVYSRFLPQPTDGLVPAVTKVNPIFEDTGGNVYSKTLPQVQLPADTSVAGSNKRDPVYSHELPGTSQPVGAEYSRTLPTDDNWSFMKPHSRLRRTPYDPKPETPKYTGSKKKPKKTSEQETSSNPHIDPTTGENIYQEITVNREKSGVSSKKNEKDEDFETGEFRSRSNTNRSVHLALSALDEALASHLGKHMSLSAVTFDDTVTFL